jgi:hypothetical protein
MIFMTAIAGLLPFEKAFQDLTYDDYSISAEILCNNRGYSKSPLDMSSGASSILISNRRSVVDSVFFTLSSRTLVSPVSGKKINPLSLVLLSDQ